MELIIDANILFAALIKDSTTYRLVMQEDMLLYSPEFLFDEYEGHRKRLLRITNRSSEDFNRQVKILKEKITQVPIKDIIPYLREAKRISPNLGDVPYIALGLRLGIPIWSNDADLKSKQDAVKVMTTGEIFELVGSNFK